MDVIYYVILDCKKKIVPDILCHILYLYIAATSFFTVYEAGSQYMRASSVGRLSIASYIKNTQPSCDPASYTVKKLVAAM
jgi:hypothetical protein